MHLFSVLAHKALNLWSGIIMIPQATNKGSNEREHYCLWQSTAGHAPSERDKWGCCQRQEGISIVFFRQVTRKRAEVWGSEEGMLQWSSPGPGFLGWPASRTGLWKWTHRRPVETQSITVPAPSHPVCGSTRQHVTAHPHKLIHFGNQRNKRKCLQTQQFKSCLEARSFKRREGVFLQFNLYTVFIFLLFYVHTMQEYTEHRVLESAFSDIGLYQY